MKRKQDTAGTESTSEKKGRQVNKRFVPKTFVRRYDQSLQPEGRNQEL